MKLIQLFEEILDNNFKVQPNGNTYDLKESSNPNYPITKLKKKGKALVYKFDVDGRIFPFFDYTKSFINKSSDYIIFNEKENALFVFVVELKSNNPQNAHAQLYASEKFVNFISSMVEAYCKINKIPIEGDNEPEIRHIVLSLKSPRFATNVKKDNKYHIHKQFDYQYLHKKAGTDLFLDNLCT